MGSSVEEAKIFLHAETMLLFQIDVLYGEKATFFAVHMACKFH